MAKRKTTPTPIKPVAVQANDESGRALEAVSQRLVRAAHSAILNLDFGSIDSLAFTIESCLKYKFKYGVSPYEAIALGHPFDPES